MGKQHSQGETELEPVEATVAYGRRGSLLAATKEAQDSESTTAEQGPGVAWDSVPEEVQKNLKEAGYKPPKAQVKEEVDDLTDLCQKHEAALPEEVKGPQGQSGGDALPSCKPGQPELAKCSWQAQAHC